MKKSHKDEAIKAIGEVERMLLGETPLSPLDRIRAKATLEYARQQLEGIQELKRIRKPKEDKRDE